MERNGYVSRLIRCGYTKDGALDVCRDFVLNLSIADLDLFVKQVEDENRVDLLQSKSGGA